MNLPLFIARRYFLSRRRKNFINVIAWLSMIGVGFATAALVIVLSVFNGIGGLLRSLYGAFDPPVKVVLVKGKSFTFDRATAAKIRSLSGVEVLTEVIEDFVYLRNRTNSGSADMVVTMKAVSVDFTKQHPMDRYITEGEFILNRDSLPCAIIGAGVRNTLSVNVSADVFPMQIFYVRAGNSVGIDPTAMYSSRQILPCGVFMIEKAFDENYILVPLSLGESLLNYSGRRTSLEIKPKKNADIEALVGSVKAVMGKDFAVLTDAEQHKDLYRLLKLEKIFTFLALALLIVVATINIFFSLMMLVIDKRKDISMLRSVGASGKLVQRIFTTEALLVSGYGTITGLLIGIGICYLQQTVGLVGMGMENAVVANYPIELQWVDLLLVLIFNVVVTMLISWYPARHAAETFDPQLL